MENRLLDSLWCFRMVSDAVQTNQRPSYLPMLYKQRVLQSPRCVHSSLLGQHPDLLRRHHATLESRQRSAKKTLKSRIVCESREMQVPLRFRRVYRLCAISIWFDHV